MNPDIESYLLGELKGDALREFEKELASNPALHKEVESYRAIVGDLKNLALLKKIQAAGETAKARRRKKKARKLWIIFFAAAAVTTATAIWFYQARTPEMTSPAETAPENTPFIPTLPNSDKIIDPKTPVPEKGKNTASPFKNKSTPTSPGPVAEAERQTTPRTTGGFRSGKTTVPSPPKTLVNFPDSLFITPAYPALSWEHPVYTPVAETLLAHKFNLDTDCLARPGQNAPPSDSLVLMLAACHLAKNEPDVARYWFNRIYGSETFFSEAAWGLSWCALLNNEPIKARILLEEVIAKNDVVFAPRAKKLLQLMKK